MRILIFDGEMIEVGLKKNYNFDYDKLYKFNQRKFYVVNILMFKKNMLESTYGGVMKKMLIKIFGVSLRIFAFQFSRIFQQKLIKQFFAIIWLTC